MMRRVLGLVLLGGLAYWNALRGSFHFDDAHAVVDNPAIRSLANVPRFFTDARLFSVLPQNQSYRPVLLSTYALTAHLAGLEPSAFLVGNLLVHLGVALLVWGTLGELLRLLEYPDAETVAWAAAAIFVVHPLGSECVSYVSARSESLAALSALAAVWTALRARRARTAWPWLVGGAIAMTAAVLTKPVVVLVPWFVLAVEAAAPGPRRIAFALALLVPAALAALLCAHMTPPLALASASHLDRATYVRSELPALWHYVRLFLWPVGQSADPDFPVAGSWAAPDVIAALAAWIAAVAWATWAIVRRRRVAAALAVAWFLLCLLPTSSVVPLAEIANEHRPYLAMAALAALAAAAVLALPGWLGIRSARAPALALVATLGILVGLTHARNGVWRTEETLWADVVAKAPGSTRAQMNYGLALMADGRLDEAEPHLREAVRLAPAYPYALINLGNWLLARGDAGEAMALFDRSVALAPELVYAHYWRGLAGERVGEAPEGLVERFRRAVELSPDHADALYHLALQLDRAGDLAGATDAARRAVAVRGAFDDRFLLAYVLLRADRVDEARPMFEALRAERPGDPRVELNLAWIARRSP